MEKVWAHSSNYTVGRQGSRISEITIHHMAGVLTARACGSIFQRANRNASSHYGIGYNGDVAQYVEEKNTAWTNGNWEANKRAVTIEISNDRIGGNWTVSDKSLESAINLIRDIAKRNGLLPLIKGKTLTWHNMYANTNCPGPYLLSKIDYIIERVNGPKTETNIKQSSDSSIEQLAREVINGKYGNGQDRIRNLGANYNAVQKRVNEILGYNVAPKNSVPQLADEVIKGLWGNGQDRINRLTRAGYNYQAVQNEVNRRLGF